MFSTVRTDLPGASALRAAALGATKHGIRLTWTQAAANGSPITGYRVYRRTGSGPKTLVATLKNVLTWIDTKNVAGRSSYYDVVAVNGVGVGPHSKDAGAFSH